MGMGNNDFKDYLKMNNVLYLCGSWIVDTKNLNYENIKNIATSIMKSIRI